MTAEFLGPTFKDFRPFLLVFSEIISAVKNELELVVGIEFKSKNSGKIDVELLQMAEFGIGMFLDPFCSIVGNSKRIGSKKIFYFNKIHHVLEEGIVKGKLCLFQNIILVAREEFSKHFG